MSEPRVIRDYLAVLAAQLPASIAEELADGLAETYQSFLRQGLASDLAAQSAVADFGDPHVIVAAFARVNPARRGARRLLLTGPVVGGCWAVVLINGRAWAWPVPLLARIVLGLALLMVIGLLTAAALGTRYGTAARAAFAGCLGIIALDVTVITTLSLVTSSMTWITLAAMAASTARIALSMQTLRPILTR